MSPIEKAQRVFRVYRLTLSSVLLLTYFFSTDNALLTIYRAELFLLVAVIWFAAVVVSGISRLIVRQDFVVTTTGNFLIDCVAICLLGYACEGLSSGLYSLLVPTTILAGLSLPRRWTLLIAAVASLGTLLAHSLLTLEAEANASGFVPAGILGVLIFLMGLAANFVSANLRTSIKAAEASARDSQRLRALNESIIARMDTGVMVVEPDGIISLANNTAIHLLKADPAEPAIARGIAIGQLPKLAKRYLTWLDHPTALPKPFDNPYSGANIRATFSALPGAENRVSTLILLEDTRMLRQQAQQLKLNTLATLGGGIAHEIRNPLSAIHQANDLLQSSSELSPDDRALTEIIDRHCVRTEEIIRVVQQLAQRVEPNMRTIALRSFIEEVAAELNEGRQVLANVELNVDPSLKISFDPANLKQVLLNVLDNGLRYSEKDAGEACIAIEAHQQLPMGHTMVDIRDLGKGVPREIVSSIFDPFFTSDRGGSGLGLFVSKELCEANLASISYVYDSPESSTGVFRIGFWLEGESL